MSDSGHAHLLEPSSSNPGTAIIKPDAKTVEPQTALAANLAKLPNADSPPDFTCRPENWSFDHATPQMQHFLKGGRQEWRSYPDSTRATEACSRSYLWLNPRATQRALTCESTDGKCDTDPLGSSGPSFSPREFVLSIEKASGIEVYKFDEEDTEIQMDDQGTMLRLVPRKAVLVERLTENSFGYLRGDKYLKSVTMHVPRAFDSGWPAPSMHPLTGQTGRFPIPASSLLTGSTYLDWEHLPAGGRCPVQHATQSGTANWSAQSSTAVDPNRFCVIARSRLGLPDLDGSSKLLPAPSAAAANSHASEA